MEESKTNLLTLPMKQISNRDKIIQSAMHHFFTKGYALTSIDDILKDVKMYPANSLQLSESLFGLFKGKENKTAEDKTSTKHNRNGKKIYRISQVPFVYNFFFGINTAQKFIICKIK